MQHLFMAATTLNYSYVTQNFWWHVYFRVLWLICFYAHSP